MITKDGSVAKCSGVDHMMLSLCSRCALFDRPCRMVQAMEVRELSKRTMEGFAKCKMALQWSSDARNAEDILMYDTLAIVPKCGRFVPAEKALGSRRDSR